MREKPEKPDHLKKYISYEELTDIEKLNPYMIGEESSRLLEMEEKLKTQSKELEKKFATLKEDSTSALIRRLDEIKNKWIYKLTKE